MEFGLLGEVRALVDGEPVELGHSRQRCVLAVLAVEVNRPVPVDRLIDRVWGDAAPNGVRTTLYGYIYHLRKAGVAISRRSGGYILTADPTTVDLHLFNRLVSNARNSGEPGLQILDAALALWRGEPFEGMESPWWTSLREELLQRRLTVELERNDLVLNEGGHQDLLARLSTLVAAHPLNERVVEQFLLAAYRCGLQAEALTCFEEFRSLLAEELGVDPGPGLRELHRRILDADPVLTSRPVEAGLVPRQLPAAPPLFIGRAKELNLLDGAWPVDHTATGERIVISAIAGAGGIGKTWLALTWAYRHLERFPDGQLFVDLQGFSPESTPLEPEVAVRGFLDALGTEPARIPTDRHAQIARYRSLVAGRRMLIVLDNAVSAEQVIPLLPGSASCTVLVTSRHRLPALLARHGARPLALGVLSAAESRALLVAALGRDHVMADEQATAELIALCGGFPLALGLVAARCRPHVSLADTVAELRSLGLEALSDVDDPAASLPVVLSWSLRHLTDRPRRMFALLGIAPGPDIGLQAAASLVGLPVQQTRADMETLVANSLVDIAPGGRYIMHDLTRAYATTLVHDLPEVVRQTALERVVDFYLHTAHHAHRLLVPYDEPVPLEPPAPGVHIHPLPDRSAAMAWLDAEHPHLLAAQHTVATHHRHRTAWQLAQALSPFHHRRGYFRESLAMWQIALDAATHLSEPSIHILAHRFVGRSHLGLRHYNEAAEHLHRALAAAVQERDVAQQADIHLDLAEIQELQEDTPEAFKHAQLALELARTLDQPIREAGALNAVGWYAALLGNFDTARDLCRAALTLCRRHHEFDAEAATLDSLGYIAYATGDHHQAIQYYDQALTLLRTLGHTYQVASTLEHLGHPYVGLGQQEQAREVWREALRLFREQGRDVNAERVQRQMDECSSR
ncbi:BTAD domain-containing putative transcriptional regulator [Actinosynnema sp. NPDC004786]